jgi:hypothetical protein
MTLPFAAPQFGQVKRELALELANERIKYLMRAIQHVSDCLTPIS